MPLAIDCSNEFLSNSRTYMYDRCRQAYAFKYVDKVKPAAKSMYFDSWLRMIRGVIIHAGVEAGFLGRDVQTAIRSLCAQEKAKGLTQEQLSALVVLYNECPTVVQNLLDWLPASDWEPIKYKGRPMVEARLEWALPGWKGFLGFADLVAKHKPTGRVMVLDWKTRETFEADDVDRFNMQFLLYSYVLNKMGVHVDGSLLVEAKPTPPKRAPRVNHDDVGGVDGVRISSDGRFRSIPTFRSRAYLEAGWNDYMVKAKVIASMRDDEIYRNMGAFSCKSCEFQKLCQAQLGGHDVEHILNTSYSGVNVILEDEEPCPTPPPQSSTLTALPQSGASSAT